MRLTLRTLLAYLDDTLDPSQARGIGQKLAESESAQELVERIKQVTRRRRLTTPGASGPSGIDPNTIAEYLDNAVSAEQANEVEQICLSSDVHLAEVAACHQILTLILGEPASVPPEANQRMYALVKGPEAIPFRKPTTAVRAGAEPHPEPRDVDETLRLGLPPLGRKNSWGSILILVGGGVVATGLLVFALFQLMNLAGGRDQNAGKDRIAKGNIDKDEGPPPKRDEARPIDKKDGEPQKDGDQKPTKKDGDKKELEPKDKTVEAVEPGDIPFGPPSTRETPLGHMVALDKDEKSLLLHMTSGRNEWKRVVPKKDAEVYSARPLLALPGVRGAVDLNKGVRLLLWGNSSPEQVYLPAPFDLFESLVELHAHDKLDLDMTLHRGRIVLTSTADKPVLIRLRYENPLQTGAQEFVDITMQSKGASIIVERFCFLPMAPTADQNEPFFKDAKNPSRKGPHNVLFFSAVSGTIFFKAGDVTNTLTAPPGSFQMYWHSHKGLTGPFQNNEVPVQLTLDPPLPKGVDASIRQGFVRARDILVKQLETKPVDIVLPETVKSTDRYARRLAVRSFAAVDDLTSLIEEGIDNADPARGDVRMAAREALRDWIAYSRDNDYKVYKVLQDRFKKKEAEIIMELFHGFSKKDTQRPERYEVLIEYLTSHNQMIRELASWHLYTLAPAGRNIAYNAAADSETRSAAAAQWRQLIPAGQLPPATAPTKK